MYCLNCSSPIDDIGPVYLCPLHAAAPALLEALKEMELNHGITVRPSGFGGMERLECQCTACRMARTAITKATKN